ncbi:hypothetical protein HQ584_01745 [Patescibacteria group bacterium]|nr:hypothetical protein [Patescibacteria group bacterium]
MDATENFRRAKVESINTEIKSTDIDSERIRLEEKYGEVWNTNEVSNAFEIVGFMAPYVVAINRETNIKGSLEFQDNPRFYFNFRSA